MALTDAAIRKAKPEAKARKLSDGRGLFLLVHPNGGRWWRFKYRIAGREKLLSLGTYPEVSLAVARDKRDAARKLVAAGIDPAEERRAKRDEAGNTFEAVATEWFDKFSEKWSPSHTRTVRGRLDLHLIPYIGKIPVRALTAADILKPLRRIETKKANETARRCLQIVSLVLRYAVASNRADDDPCHNLRGALNPVEVEHHAAITDPAEVGALLRAIDDYKGSMIVKCALRLAPLVFVRPGELRKAEWSEINFLRAQWEISGEKMKMKQPHIVPLSTQALAILRELFPVTGDGKRLFPSGRSAERPMSDNAILSALRRMEIPKDVMSGHGFRAMARTILDEVLGVRVDLIEHQLAHAVKDPNGRAYNRTAFLPERTKMMQTWADYLDALKKADDAATKRA